VTKSDSSSMQRSHQPPSSPPTQNHRHEFPRDDRYIKCEVPSRLVERAPHPVVSRKCRVHHQHVTRELVIGIKIRDVVEHQQRVVQGHGKNHRQLDRAQRHRSSREHGWYRITSQKRAAISQSPSIEHATRAEIRSSLWKPAIEIIDICHRLKILRSRKKKAYRASIFGVK